MSESRLLPQRLSETPQEFRFFQAVRLFQLASGKEGAVGRFSNPADEAVRFAAHQSLGFPASQIQDIEFREDAPPKMTVNFMGLTGPVGELPVFYTAYVIQRNRLRDHTLADFLDLFNHRIISLFYRSWEKYRFAVPYERGEVAGLTHNLLDIAGLGTPGLRDRQPVDDRAFIYYAGLLSQKPRSAQGLKQMLEDYFDVEVEVVQFVGSWRPLDPEMLCRLVDEESEGSESTMLGGGAVAGDEVWDPQSAVRLRLGPMSLVKYLEFLPDGAAFPKLQAMCRFYAGQDIDFEVQLVLRREEAPKCQLGAGGATAPRLGWLSWARRKPLAKDPDETMFRLQEED